MSEKDAGEEDMTDIIKEAALEATVSGKRGPGRPRKRDQSEKIPLNGISSKPAVKSHVMELSYENPKIFKRIFQLFKGHNCNEVLITFEKETITMKSKSHQETCFNIVCLRGAYMNHYYCKDKYTVAIKRETMGEIVNSFGKEHAFVDIILRENDYKNYLYINTKDQVMDRTEGYQISLINIMNCEVKEDDFKFSHVNYPLSFEMPGGHFRKVVNEFDKKTNIIEIRKNGSEPLTFTYNCDKTTHESIYNKPEKINLKSDIDDNDMLAVNINVKQLRSFTTIVGTNEKIYFHVDKFSPLSVMINVDERAVNKINGGSQSEFSCTIETYIYIHRERKSNNDHK